MKTAKRERMTASQARTFPTISLSSAIQVTDAIQQRAAAGIYPACECNCYEDIFTFNRWLALGMAVRKGEKAMKIASYVPIASTAEPNSDEAQEEAGEKPRLRPATVCLFCRCQVDPAKPRKNND